MGRLVTAVRVALQSIWTHPLRSVLTIVSIAMGVSAVAGVVTAGNAARARIAEEINSFGTNVIVATPITRATSDGRRASLTVDDGRAIAREAPAVTAVAPVLSAPATLANGSRRYRTTSVGTTRDYFQITLRKVGRGGLFSRLDEVSKARVCVLGETVRQKLWGSADPVGQVVTVGSTALHVVGVLERKGPDIFGKDQDDVLLLPIESFRSHLASVPGADVSSLLLSAADAERVERAVQQIDAVLRSRHRIALGESLDVSLTAQTAALTTLRDSVRSLTALLSAIAAISLIVGGIGVMNIMLVAVKERRREIGVRMALGARSRDIRDQFLVESLFVSSLGGAVGLTLTGLGIFAAQRVLVGWSLELNVQAALLGFGTSAAVGALFGFVPAHRASQIEPQLALVQD